VGVFSEHSVELPSIYYEIQPELDTDILTAITLCV